MTLLKKVSTEMTLLKRLSTEMTLLKKVKMERLYPVISITTP
jgi:hypothetical protein